MTTYRIPAPSAAERELINTINTEWTREQALSELRAHLQIAVEIELATLPIYLYTYYSVDRKPPDFPDSELSRWADQAGALLMSVPVEEMLHMSLASNVLFSLGQMPELYQKSPGPYPTNLPGHQKLGPDGKPLKIPLAKLSFAQLWQFLEIEFPAVADAPPEADNWKTIGQIYSYVRSIIFSDHVLDQDFQRGFAAQQIQPTNYSPNNIDTAWPDAAFDFKNPKPAVGPDSTARVTRFASAPDDHLGATGLITISSCEDALRAIATIDFQGEGFGHGAYDDPTDQEFSHYFKFVTVQSKLEGYPDHDDFLAERKHALLVPPPPKPDQQFGPDDLARIVFDVPDNPVAEDFKRPGRKEIADLASGLYQYMLIMTETIFLVPSQEQKVYFNRAMHMSMIWVLDKLLQAMREVRLDDDSIAKHPDGTPRLSCPFANIDLGPRAEAFGNLSAMAQAVDQKYGKENWYQDAYLGDYIQQITTLPDVSAFWEKQSRFAGAPRFPANPPTVIPNGGDRHACMGLNSCRNQGRTLDNACAGQGFCSTALAYNPANPQEGLVSDHTCHVKNDCAGQGGCGLYGTGEEQNHPGANDCRSLGSCATPINAERFSTAGPNQGKSVWLRAREVFAAEVWPQLREHDPDLPEQPPQVPGTQADPDLFAYGPTIQWIEDYSDEGMTACGASGLSGAGSCA